MENASLGRCECPVCKDAEAEVRSDKNGRAYVKCEACVTMVRTMSRIGDRAMRALIAKTNTPRESVNAEPAGSGEGVGAKQAPRSDKPTPAASKRGGFGDALTALTGGE